MPTVDEMKQQRDGQLAFGKPVGKGGLRPVLPVTSATRESVFRSDGQGGEIEYKRAPDPERVSYSAEAGNVVARRKLGKGDDWQPFQWRVINLTTHDVMVTGAVPIGQRKNGNPIWPKVKDCEQVVVAKGERDAEIARWEAETGKCAHCIDGAKWCGWSAEKGPRYRECTECDGKGVRTISVQRRNSEAR